ncbi:FMN reductase [Hyphomicrobium sp.]|uniref:FMN reductase n=1 Tax=Hyphomicrobium sp. TaxID=82 RepID=UPI001E007323|nr:FMN reductase [Hyphomicrobium sp.]MBY0558586.1 FMN reductase [Hyphomicrobium sp.]
MSALPTVPLNVVAVSGNMHRPSKSRALAAHVSEAIAARARIDVRSFDLVDAGPGLGAFVRTGLSPDARKVLEAIENAEALIVSAPVYKGSYPGLLKHLFDFVDPTALVGKPVLLAAVGGGLRHALVIEHQLRPLFGFFSALTVPTAVYAADSNFIDGVIIDPVVKERIDLAVSQFVALLKTVDRKVAVELA